MMQKECFTHVFSRTGQKLIEVCDNGIPRLQVEKLQTLDNNIHLVYNFAGFVLIKARYSGYQGFHKTRKMYLSYYKRKILGKNSWSWMRSYEDNMILKQPNLFLIEFIQAIVSESEDFSKTLPDFQARTLKAELAVLGRIS